MDEQDLISNKNRDSNLMSDDEEDINVAVLLNGTGTGTDQHQHQKQQQQQLLQASGDDLPGMDRRAHAESVKHDIEQALNQGYTRNLVIAVLQALSGAFLYGWNVEY